MELLLLTALVYKLSTANLREPESHNAVSLALGPCARRIRFPGGELFNEGANTFSTLVGESDQLLLLLPSIEEHGHGSDTKVAIPLVGASEVLPQKATSSCQEGSDLSV